jgi:NitT/TauT family transport system permease protein
LLLFGLGERSKVILIALIVVFQVAVAVRGAALNVPGEAYRHMASMGATPLQTLRHVTLPAILPELIVCAKLAVGTALSVLFFTEAYGTRAGLGWYIMDAWSRVDYPGMYLGILTLSLLGFGLFAVLDALSGRLCRWKRHGPRD